jgi:hypothetical protein
MMAGPANKIPVWWHGSKCGAKGDIEFSTTNNVYNMVLRSSNNNSATNSILFTPDAIGNPFFK